MANAVVSIGGQTATAGGMGWLDPRLILALCKPTEIIITLAAGIVTQILPGDPGRVGFVVVKGVALPAFPRIGPRPDVSTFGIRADTTIDVRTFVPQDWLSLITGEWWALSADNGPIKIHQFTSPL